MNKTMWMVRAEGGDLFDTFREQGVAAIWSPLAPFAKPGVERSVLFSKFMELEPTASKGKLTNGASQVWRFVNEIAVGDSVITYSPTNRVYLIGVISGKVAFREDWEGYGPSLVIPVDWQPKEIQRDALKQSSKNSLGSTLTIFQVPQSVSSDVVAVMAGAAELISKMDIEDVVEDPLADIEVQAIERVKDLVNQLDWDEMQHLVAGILRAMGYKTQVSPHGPDRGKDIVASPDGFGFENPRIVVEVKHRSGQMGSAQLRSFLGGRHAQDRGLYVSTGGFSKEAAYEADRASIPVSLWSLDNVVRALMENYDKTDAETKRLVPLKHLYWPA